MNSILRQNVSDVGVPTGVSYTRLTSHKVGALTTRDRVSVQNVGDPNTQ